MRRCDCCNVFIYTLTKILLKYLWILYAAYKIAYYLCQGRCAFSLGWLIDLFVDISKKKLWTNFREFMEGVGLRTERKLLYFGCDQY